MVRILPFLVLLGCGAKQPAPAQAPSASAQAPSHPYKHILEGPGAAETLEPSGVTIIGDTLWIVSDDDGWVVAYDLPLIDGVNEPAAAFQIPASSKHGVKLEAIAPYGDGGALIFDIIPKRYWICQTLANHCRQASTEVPTRANNVIKAFMDPAKPWRYFTFEAIAGHGDARIFGVRSHTLEDGKVPVPMPFVVNQWGATALDGKPWEVNGRQYALSDMAIDKTDETLWMTWSYEKHVPKQKDEPEAEIDAKNTRDDVSGFIARAKLDPKTGLPQRLERCGDVLAGKPEGIAVTPDRVYVVFDQDKERKGGAADFPLKKNQDYALTLRKTDITCK